MPGPDTTSLRGEQVELRPVAPEDAAVLRAIHADPEVARWWGEPGAGFPLTDEPQTARLTIWHRGEVAGLIQFGEESEPMYRFAWIDIFVAPARAGRGIGTDAVRTLVDHLIREQGHHRVTIDPAADNAAARRCYEKAGFGPVGLMRLAERDPVSGRWRDAVLMELVVDPPDPEPA